MSMETLQVEKKIQMHSNLQDQLNWVAIQKKLFPAGIPKSHEWSNVEDILHVLNTIASISDNNQLFYPTGGADEIKSAFRSNEKGCIEIITNGHVEVMNPKRLIFNSLEEDMDWNFFRLELNPIEVSGVYGDIMDSCEELIEYESGKYISISFWGEDEVGEQLVPQSARLVTRHLRGSFVVFSESSSYNNPEMYDARHNTMNSTEFQNYIEKLAKSAKSDVQVY